MAKVKVSNILFNFLSIVTAIAVLFVGFNIASGSKGYAVTSDSMKDTLEIGDVVFSRKTAFEELKAGDVVTVSIDGGENGYFTHRIVEIDREKRTVVTKGDANPSVDPMPTEAERIVGKMWYSVPLLGYFSIAFSEFTGTDGLIILAVIAAVLIGINIVLSKIKKKARGDSDEQN